MGCLISQCPPYRRPIDAIFRVAGKHFLIEAKDSADAGIEANDYAGHQLPVPEEKFDWEKYCLFFKNIKTEECERVRSKHLKLKDLEKKFGKSLMEKYCLKWTNIKGEECERIRSKHLKLTLPEDENTKVAKEGKEEGSDYVSISYDYTNFTPQILKRRGEGKKGGSDYGKGKHWDPEKMKLKYCLRFPHMPDCKSMKLPKVENTAGDGNEADPADPQKKAKKNEKRSK